MNRFRPRIRPGTTNFPFIVSGLYFFYKMIWAYQDRGGYIKEVVVGTILVFLVSLIISVVLKFDD